MISDSSSRPILIFLGIDGVVSAPLAGEEWGRQVVSMVTIPWLSAERRQVEVTVAPRPLSTMNQLIEVFDVRLCWLSDWLEDRAVGRFLMALPEPGLPRGARIELPPLGPDGFLLAGWKHAALLAHVSKHAPGAAVIWIDDGFDPEATAEPANALPGSDVLLLATDPDRGLTPDHAVEIEKFCSNVRAGRAC